MSIHPACGNDKRPIYGYHQVQSKLLNCWVLLALIIGVWRKSYSQSRNDSKIAALPKSTTGWIKSQKCLKPREHCTTWRQLTKTDVSFLVSQLVWASSSQFTLSLPLPNSLASPSALLTVYLSLETHESGASTQFQGLSQSLELITSWAEGAPLQNGMFHLPLNVLLLHLLFNNHCIKEIPV